MFRIFPIFLIGIETRLENLYFVGFAQKQILNQLNVKSLKEREAQSIQIHLKKILVFLYKI